MARRKRKPVRVMHFRSKAAYRRWCAYGHMRSKRGKRIPYPANKRRAVMVISKTNPQVYIAGRKHRVHHVRRRR